MTGEKSAEIQRARNMLDEYEDSIYEAADLGFSTIDVESEDVRAHAFLDALHDLRHFGRQYLRAF